MNTTFFRRFFSAGLSLVLLCLLFAGSLPRAQAAENDIHVLCASKDLSEVDAVDRRNEPLWRQGRYNRRCITKVVFEKGLSRAPEDAWDVSEQKDGSILAWKDDGLLTIVSDGTIRLNPCSAWLFAGFINLEEIDFGGIVDTVGVKDFTGMFNDCLNLKQLDVSFFDTSEAELMGYMFSDCRSLKALDVSGFDTAKCKDLSFMFFRCMEVSELDVSGFDTGSNMYMNSMFYECKKLEKVDVSHFDTSRVVGMGSTFYGCEKLAAPDVTNFDLSRVCYWFNFMDPGREINGQPWEKFFQ